MTLPADLKVGEDIYMDIELVEIIGEGMSLREALRLFEWREDWCKFHFNRYKKGNI